MISFLNGFLLPALFAAAIPILLHFLSKKKAKQIPFSSLKFLKAIENQRIRRVKLYQLLLILLRTLFIIFLVLSFTRPTISNWAADKNNAQTTAVIVLDDSYSMQAFANSKTYFEIAKEMLLNLLQAFNRNDAVFIYTQGSKIIPLNLDQAEKTINNLKVTNTVFNADHALFAADSIFKDYLNLNNELYFLSDFKISLKNDFNSFKNDFNNFSAFKIPLADNVPFKNISIDTVVVENQLLEINKPVKITVYLSNQSESEVETNINLFAGDERVNMEFIALQEKQTAQQIIYFTPKSNGLHNLKIQLDEDDLSIDNHWYFSINMPDNIDALLITDAVSPELSILIKILSENTIFNIKTANYKEWPGLNLNLFNIVIFNNFLAADKNEFLILKNYVASGKQIVLVPGDETTNTIYNMFTQNIVGKNLISEMIMVKNKSFFSVESNKTENPLFETLFRDKHSSFSAPKVYKYFKITSFEQSFLKLTNNDLFISKTGPLILFSSSLNNNWNDFSVNGLFMPLMYRILYYATQLSNPVSKNLKVGDDIGFTSQTGAISDNFTIYEPDGNSYNVLPVFQNNTLQFMGGITHFPGIYTLTRNENIFSTVSVNLSSRELKYAFNSAEQFINLDPDQYMSQVKAYRSGFELWIFFLTLALIMILLEMALIKVIERTPFLKKA